MASFRTVAHACLVQLIVIVAERGVRVEAEGARVAHADRDGARLRTHVALTKARVII